MDARTRKQVIVWLASGCVLIFLMVVVGGITRLTGSGLSMVTWKPVTGVIPPLSEGAWQQAFEEYKQYPEFKIRNFDFTLDDFKSIYWWEFIHRLLGRLIGVVFLIPFLYFVFRKKLSRDWILKLLWLFALGGFQGAVGWFMVASGLQNDPHVSHYRLAAHLLTALLAFSVTFWFMLDVSQGDKRANKSSGLKKASIWLLALIGVQIFYGALVAGLKAGRVFNTWPKMGDQWVPDAVTAMQPLWHNFLEGLAGVQFIHRYVAYAVVGVVVWLWVKSRKTDAGLLRKRFDLLLMVVGFQFVLGVMTLLLSVPVWLGVLHQLGAFMLLATHLYVLHGQRTTAVAST